MIRLIYTLLFSSSFYFAFGQAQFFERPLDAGRTSLGLDVIPTGADEYLFSNLLPTPGLIAGGNVNLTKLRPSGAILWSKDFLFDTQTSSGNITPWSSEFAYALAGLTAGADSVVHGYLSKVESLTGDALWSKKIPLNGALHYSNMGKAQALILPGDTVALAMGAANFENIIWKNDYAFAQLDSAGNFIWGKHYCFSCNGLFELTLGNVVSTSDGGFLLSGGLQRSDNTVLNRELFLMKVDAAGEFLWSKGYTIADTLAFYLSWGFDAAELPNGNLVAVGQSRDLIDNIQRGLILETDSAGTFIRALQISLPAAQGVFLKHVAALDSNAVVVHGTAVEPGVERNFLFQIALDSGQIDWQTQFAEEVETDGRSVFDGFSTLPAGYAMIVNHENEFPFLVVADEDGRTGCHKPISLLVQDSLEMIVGEYTPQIFDLTEALDFPVTQQDFADYDIDVPVLDLGESQIFCDPTTIPLDATVPGAESYLWNNGATTPMILAEAPGLFTVEDTSMVLCWILRDTISFNILPPPMVTIAADTTGYCEFGQVTLTAAAIGAQTLLWSNGETSATILVTSAGAYSVVATNICGSATSNINLVLPECGITEECKLEIPNAFTPDGDGVNDQFRALSNCENYEEFYMRIYSRWGQLVFETRNPTQGWNGVFKDKALPSDLYGWILEYRFPDEAEVKLEKGEVTLLR